MEHIGKEDLSHTISGFGYLFLFIVNLGFYSIELTSISHVQYTYLKFSLMWVNNGGFGFYIFFI